MNTLHVKDAETGAVLATIDRLMTDHGSEYWEARILSSDRARQFPIDPGSPSAQARAFHRLQCWIDSQIGEV